MAVRKLLRFHLDPNAWTNADRIHADVRDVATNLYQFLAHADVLVDTNKWAIHERGNSHPFALEIEGLAYRDGNLLMGLKWPLAKGDALILVYSWEQATFKAIERVPLRERGISELAYDARNGRLFVVANPPERERTDHPEDAMNCFGESIVYVFQWPLGVKIPAFSHKIGKFARPLAKLEGLALLGKEVWLSFDGPKPGLARHPLIELDK
jgi:hypothetical protein